MGLPKLPDPDIVRESLADARNQVHNWRIGCSPEEAREAFDRLMTRLEELERHERTRDFSREVVLQRDH